MPSKYSHHLLHRSQDSKRPPKNGSPRARCASLPSALSIPVITRTPCDVGNRIHRKIQRVHSRQLPLLRPREGRLITLPQPQLATMRNLLITNLSVLQNVLGPRNYHLRNGSACSQVRPQDRLQATKARQMSEERRLNCCSISGIALRSLERNIARIHSINDSTLLPAHQDSLQRGPVIVAISSLTWIGKRTHKCNTPQPTAAC